MSAIKDFFGALKKGGGSTANELLNGMVTEDENLALKSDVDNPLALNVLNMVKDYLKTNKMNKSSTLLDGFITGYLRYRIPYKRMSRKEMIEGITAVYKYEMAQQKQREGLMRSY